MQKFYQLKNVALLFIPIFFTASALFAAESEAFSDFSQMMDVEVNDNAYTFVGNGRVDCINNSGDTLRQLFFHAYFNAFQPESGMQIHAEETGNAEMAMKIAALKPAEIGKLDIISGVLNSQTVVVSRVGTIIRVDFPVPIPPSAKIRFSFNFSGQIPLEIRRAGRNNAQGVQFSMAQWYPKLCQYDQHGWHNNQYVGREFYGVVGTYDVQLTLPAKYIVGASGVLQNPTEVRHGYEFDKDTTVYPKNFADSANTTWHFIARNSHDFAWVADSEYIHTVRKTPTTTIHVLCKKNLQKAWQKVGEYCERTLQFFGKKYGEYPYSTFTCAQAGDGGMEYPQLVMITHRPPRALLSVIVHEIGHQWFYGMVASNETKHAWMDEGFTSYITTRAMREEFGLEEESAQNAWRAYFYPKSAQGISDNASYLKIARSGNEEPLAIQHDKFIRTNESRLVYDKGAALLRQCEYSFGRAATDSALRVYATTWRFRHPYPADFEKICEQRFGQRLDDFFDFFLLHIGEFDYAIENAESTFADGKWQNSVELSKSGNGHVPLNLFAETGSGKILRVHIPSDVLNRPNASVLAPWLWAFPRYTARFTSDEEIAVVRLDTSGTLIDFDRTNNARKTGGFFKNATKTEVALWKRYDLVLPLDYVGISLRPSIWYSEYSGLQMGMRADFSKNFNPNELTLGAYYNVKGDKQFQWQFGYREEIRFLGDGARYEVSAFDMDGASSCELRLSKVLQISPKNTDRWKFQTAMSYWKFDRFYPNFSDQSALSEFFSGIFSARFDAKETSFLLESSFAGNEKASGMKISGFARWNLGAIGKQKFKAILGFSQATELYPTIDLPTLRETTEREKFGNIPFRFVRFVEEQRRDGRVFFNGNGFVRAENTPLQTLVRLRLENEPFAFLQWLNIAPPVLENIRAGVYGVAALGYESKAIFSAADKHFFSEAGMRLNVNISAMYSEISTLFLFGEPLSLDMYLPFYSYNSSRQTSNFGTNGVWFGISSAF